MKLLNTATNAEATLNVIDQKTNINYADDLVLNQINDLEYDDDSGLYHADNDTFNFWVGYVSRYNTAMTILDLWTEDATELQEIAFRDAQLFENPEFFDYPDFVINYCESH